MSDSPGRRQSRLRLRQLGITTVSRTDAFDEGMDRPSPIEMAAHAAPKELTKAYTKNRAFTKHTASNFERVGDLVEHSEKGGSSITEAGHTHSAVYKYDSTLHPGRKGGVIVGISASEKPPTPIMWSSESGGGVVPGQYPDEKKSL